MNASCLRDATRNVRRIGVLLVVVAGLAAAQVPVPMETRTRTTLRMTRTQLDAGNARAASAQYDAVITELKSSPATEQRATVLAAALFGRASASQQLIAAQADSLTLRMQALADYQEAEQLDSTHFAGAAPNNIGIVWRDAGHHREALTAFQRATRSTHAARAVFFVHMGDEYATLGIPDSAIAAYRSALRVDSTLSGARGALIRVMLSAYPPDSMIAVATKWSVNPAHGILVTDALHDMLRGRRRDAGLPDTALTLLVVNFAAMGLGPSDILRAHEARLVAAAPCDSTPLPGRAGSDGAMSAPSALCTPVCELLELARRAATRDPRGVNRKFDKESWWASRVDRLAVWSALLRSFAAYYEGEGNRRLAVAYYEAALARPWTGSSPPPWMDIESIAPMAMLYAQSAQDVSQLNDLLSGVFLGKAAAYERNDVARLRRMHTALAAFFVARNEWVSGPRGALFQLERMNMMTARLNAKRPADDQLVDPPDLLNALRQQLCRVGRLVDAERVWVQVADGYRRTDRADGAPKAACDGVP